MTSARRWASRAAVVLVPSACIAACVVEGSVGGDLPGAADGGGIDSALVVVPAGDAADAATIVVAGEYVLDVRSGKNECGLTPWDDASVTPVPVTVLQDGSDVRAVLVDLVGLPTALLLGSSEYRGEIRGDRLALAIDGSVTSTEGPCTFAYVGLIDARYSAGRLAGTVRYVRVFRAGDCSGRECESEQSFDGLRDGGSE